MAEFTISAGGITTVVLDYGAIVQSLRVPDREGRVADVVLGYDTPAEYEADEFYLGAVVGRSAGRMGGAGYTLDGERVRLSANDGPNHLHGGFRGFGKATWRGRQFEDAAGAGVVLEHISPDGDEGYPGDLAVRVTYTLTHDAALRVDFHATTDRATPVNLTQHSYFNLAGEGAGDVLGHELEIAASAYTPLGADLIPTGVLALVEGTPLDFRQPHTLGERIRAEHEQLRIAGGYDHNFVLDGRGYAAAARLRDPGSGRVLEVFTSEPGMQLYTGNFLDAAGKHGHRYGPRAGVCLETQHFPDAPNQPGFPSTILRPGQEYRSRTEFRFSVA